MEGVPLSFYKINVFYLFLVFLLISVSKEVIAAGRDNPPVIAALRRFRERERGTDVDGIAPATSAPSAPSVAAAQSQLSSLTEPLNYYRLPLFLPTHPLLYYLLLSTPSYSHLNVPRSIVPSGFTLLLPLIPFSGLWVRMKVANTIKLISYCSTQELLQNLCLGVHAP